MSETPDHIIRELARNVYSRDDVIHVPGAASGEWAAWRKIRYAFP